MEKYEDAPLEKATFAGIEGKGKMLLAVAENSSLDGFDGLPSDYSLGDGEFQAPAGVDRSRFEQLYGDELSYKGVAITPRGRYAVTAGRCVILSLDAFPLVRFSPRSVSPENAKMLEDDEAI